MSKKLQSTTTDVAVKENETSTALTVQGPTEVSAYKFMSLEEKKFKRAVESNLGNDGFSIRSLTQIKIPSGGSKVWELTTSAGDESVAKFNGVIVHWGTTRALFNGEYGAPGADKFPVCISDNGRVGIGTPGGDCRSCPFAQFGSKQGGKPGQACGIKRNLFIVNQTSLLPIIVRLSAMSIPIADKYALSLLSDGDPLEEVLTEFSLISTVNAANQKYSQAVLKKVSNLNEVEIERVAQYKKIFGPLFGQRVEFEDMDLAAQELSDHQSHNPGF